MYRSAQKFVYLFFALACSITFAPARSHAVSLPIDLYLEGDTSIIPFLPVGTLDINDLGVDEVRFDLTPIAGLKFDTLGLGLDASVNKFQLVLTPITPDNLNLDTGGWLGFPISINFTDKPMTPVSFKLSAPGLDATDFLHLPASVHYTNTNFALRFWFMLPGVVSDGPIDTTAGHDPSTPVPEPITAVLLLGGLAGAGFIRPRANKA